MPTLPAQQNIVSGLGQSGNIQTLTEAFKQGFIFELIDSEVAQPLEVHVMVVNPQGYTLSEPFQVELTPNMANRVVREGVGQIIREVTLRGTYGRSPKQAAGYEGAQVNSKLASGTVHFSALRNMFRRYSDLMQDPARAHRIRMVFHVLRDDDHFLVEPRSFETPLDEKARLHYPFMIKLAVLGIDKGLQRRTIDRFNNPLRDISEAFQDARAFFADATASVELVKSQVSSVQAVLLQAAGMINAVGNLVSGVSDLITFPLQSFTNGIAAIADASDRLADIEDEAAYGPRQEFARTMRKLEQSLDRIAVYGDRFEERGRKRQNAVTRAFRGEARVRQSDVSSARGGPLLNAGNPAANGGATVGSRTRVAAGGDLRGGGLSIPDDTPFIEVTIRSGDTLDRIASEHGTDPAVLALINDLYAPYIVRGGGPGFANIGDRILVPVAGLNSADGRGSQTAATPADLLYGTDLRITATGSGRNLRIDLAMSASRRDFALVRGVDNIAQGLTISINTEIGATQFLPNVGIRRNVGRQGTLQELLLANVLLREAVLSDSRIERIAKSLVVLDGDTLSQEITPVLRGGAASQAVSLPLGSLSGS